MDRLEALTDAQLIAAARTDDLAFREFYDRYGATLQRFFARRTHDQAAAVDLTAETFAQAWISRKRFRDRAGGSGAPWLFAIARHVLLRSVRTARLESAARERLQMTAAPLAAQPEWLEGLDADLEAALAALPGPRRVVLELRVLEGRSYAQIAEVVGCTPLAARIRVSRSLAWLRTQLEGGRP